ncbi:hypothetical protein [uncultured Parasphingopyxis sp.]|uniref:hypothetical protein n=1 Tax=uncultured Parasphingopyxis sp. TaxID=1547918 RepID=UPI002609ABC3|nr:hypothetical protein [uncultured Parasphingopyxis sp.]
MAQRKRRDIDKALQKKGFKKSENDHSYYIYHDLSGRKTTKRTKLSHGTQHKDIDDSLLTVMARQIKLPKKKFLELVDCTLDQKGYEKLLGSQRQAT